MSVGQNWFGASNTPNIGPIDASAKTAPALSIEGPRMSYKTKAAATADRACLARLHAALNAAHNAVRRDECRLWTVRGSRGYVSTWGDGQTWLLAVGSRTPRHWTFAKQRMASFPGLAQITQDGDDEGVFRLMRLPTPEEAAEIRRAAGVRQSSGSPSDGRRFTPAKTGDRATSMRFGELPVHDPVPDTGGAR
jgi:hypothetical protein